MNAEELHDEIAALLSTNRAHDAETLVKKWLERGGDRLTGLSALASVYSQRGQYAAAEQLYDDLMQTGPSSLALQNNRAANLIDGAIDGEWTDDRDTRLRQGTEILKGVIAENPGFSAARYNLSNGLSALGSQQESRAQLHFVIESDVTPEALVNLANCYRDIRRFSEAIDLYMRALRLKPDHDMAWANLAVGFCHAYYQSAARFPHFLILAEIACQRSLACHDGRSRAPLAVRQARESLRTYGAENIPAELIRKWDAWFEVSAASGDADLAQRYAAVAQREGLLLNLFSDCPHLDAYFPERLICSGFTHAPSEERRAPEWFTILNTIHSEFHSARSDYILSQLTTAESIQLDQLVRYVDLGDTADHGRSSKQLLQCIASCMNIFDKIALFCRSYFNVTMRQKEVWFSGQASIFKKLTQIKEPGVRENLSALRSMAGDLDNSFFRRLQRCRNAITHRYMLILARESVVKSEHNPKDPSRITDREARELAKNSLMLAKAGIHYVTALITCRDWHLEKDKKLRRRPPLATRSPAPEEG